MESKSMEKTIIEGNRAIAEFMGKTIYPKHITDDPEWKGERRDYEWNEIKYHSSWEWLMPVVEKIKGIKHGLSFQMSFDKGLSVVSIYDYDNEFQICQERYSTKEKSAIETTWKVIVKFISWYNSQGVKPAK